MFYKEKKPWMCGESYVIIIVSHFFRIFSHSACLNTLKLGFYLRCVRCGAVLWCGIAQCVLLLILFMAYVFHWNKYRSKMRVFFVWMLPMMIRVHFSWNACMFTTITMFQWLRSQLTVKLINISISRFAYFNCTQCNVLLVLIRPVL